MFDPTQQEQQTRPTTSVAPPNKSSEWPIIGPRSTTGHSVKV